MKKLAFLFRLDNVAIKTAAGSALIAMTLSASASEGFKLRQTSVGSFGGEIAAGVDNPGFFGTAALTQVRITGIADDSGNALQLPARSTSMPAPYAAYKFNAAAGSIAFSQNQTQLNLAGGYLTESTYADGRLAFIVNLPFIQQSRSFLASQPLGTVATTNPGLSAALASSANAQVQAAVAARNASQNASVSGPGDTELSAAWVKHKDRLKIVAGVSLFVPTGAYDKNRGPNPGFGNFYTLRPGIALSYALNPSPVSSWDSGVTLAGRLSYGTNTTNKDTSYRSGNFMYAEVGAVKVTRDWGFGANLNTTQQVTNDSGSGDLSVAVDSREVPGGLRYKNSSFGPFLSYKLPGKDAGINLHYSKNFGSRNALISESLQLRLIKAW
jgi:hypothetical protein